MNIWKRTEKNGIYSVLLCMVLCGTTLCGCKSASDAEKDGLGSYTYGEEKSQCSDTVHEGSDSEEYPEPDSEEHLEPIEADSEDYLEPIRRANYSFFSEINGAWFVEDSDRFAYCERYRLPHDGRCSVTGKIQLAEMKEANALAQAVNRYHEEMYENHKARMQGYGEAEMKTEVFATHTDETRYCDNIYTLASFRWGNVFTVLDIEETPDAGCRAVIANFNSMTGEKYEAADLFNTADYVEELTDIIRQRYGDLDADEWSRILHSRFSFALTYRGLLLYGDGPEKISRFAWENIADILAPELIADVVRYSEWNNPYRFDTETWTGGHLYDIFEANQGSDAVEWHKSSGYHYIKAEAGGEKETEEKWFVDDSDRFSYYAECELEQPYEGYGSGVWEIQLAEMKGTDALAEAVNRYHEELYESRKAQMQIFQEEAAAMDAEEVQDSFWKTHTNLFTMAAFRWGNLFTVVDMDDVGYKGCGIEMSASFNATTGEKYEFENLFQGENYREELLEIIRKENERNEYFNWWIDDLEPGGFTYLISYHGLLIGEAYESKYVLVKWEDLRDILSPEFVSDVLVDTD